MKRSLLVLLKLMGPEKPALGTALRTAALKLDSNQSIIMFKSSAKFHPNMAVWREFYFFFLNRTTTKPSFILFFNMRPANQVLWDAEGE